MSISTVLMMVVTLSLLWGGLFFFLSLARKQERLEVSEESKDNV